MNYFLNLKIGVRLAVGFGLTIVAALAIAVYAQFVFAKIGTEVTLLTSDRIVKVEQLNTMRNNLDAIASSVRNIALLHDEAAIKDEHKHIAELREANTKLVDLLTAEITSVRGRGLLKTVMEARAPYNAAMEQAIALATANKNDEARDLLLGEGRQRQQAYFASMDGLKAYQADLMARGGADVAATISLARVSMIGVAVTAGVVAIFLAILITRSITGPIRQAVQVAETVAAGDLGSQITSTRTDETGQLLAALRKMNAALVKIVGDVRNASDSIATGSAQIATGNADLSQRTEEQASNLQQTAASMEQLTVTVKNNADTARVATQLASEAAAVAAEHGSQVGRVVTTMEDITASSRKIADIIGVIDGIAFQTNILALNAAVEAARAGEQGRGFAVVASEVRSLAQRSAQAAKEIKTLISDSVNQVEGGCKLVGEAGQTMNAIVAQVRRVSDMIGEISASSIEQSAGIGQVGDAVSQLDQVTQQNAALVEESAAAADSLSQQAAQLAQTVAVFKLA